MALQGGHRFTVSMGDVFPDGVYAMSVEQAQDYDEKSGRRTPSKDKQTGEWVWTVTVIDRDRSEQVREKQVKVKVTAPVMPMLPGEIAPGSGLHPVEFTGLTITPYINEGRGRPRLAYSIRATGMYAQGKAPADPATQTGRSGGPAAHGGPLGQPEGKVA